MGVVPSSPWNRGGPFPVGGSGRVIRFLDVFSGPMTRNAKLESIVSTESYLHADMALKEKALSQANQGGVPVKRYRPPDQLLAFLESL